MSKSFVIPRSLAIVSATIAMLVFSGLSVKTLGVELFLAKPLLSSSSSPATAAAALLMAIRKTSSDGLPSVFIFSTVLAVKVPLLVPPNSPSSIHTTQCCQSKMG